MNTIAFLSYCGFNFNGLTDVDRRDVEMMLQQRNQGLKPNGQDYLFQPMQTGWQISGLTPMGARAVCTVAQALKIIPNRMDITLQVTDGASFRDDADYNTVRSKLIDWFKVNKPKLNVADMLPLTGERKVLFGSKNSRWCLWLQEQMTVNDVYRNGLQITWTVRNENAVAAWDYFVGCGSDKDFEHYSREAWAACTNTILGADFFDLGISDMPYLHKEKPAAEQKDWYAYLAAVAKKMIKHYIEEPGASFEKDMTFITREIERELDKVEAKLIQ